MNPDTICPHCGDSAQVAGTLGVWLWCYCPRCDTPFRGRALSEVSASTRAEAHRVNETASGREKT